MSKLQDLLDVVQKIEDAMSSREADRLIPDLITAFQAYKAGDMPYAEAYSYLKARVPSEAVAMESKAGDKPILGYFVVDLGAANPHFVDDHGDVFPERVMLCLHPPGASPDGDGLWVEVAGEESGTSIFAPEKVTGPAVLDRMLGFFVGEIARLRGK